jgi:integrase
LAEFIGGPDGLLVLFAGFTGLRAGECAGLQVGDLDLMRGRVTVQRSVSEAHGGSHLSLPKNGKVRTVAIPPFLRDHLVEHLRSNGVDGDKSAQVFTNRSGGVFRHSNFYQRVFRPAVREFGLEGFRFHDLRHSYAAMLIAADGHPRAIMERMGHSSIQITLDTYGHLFPGLDEALTDGLETAFRDASPAVSRPVRGLDDLRHSA